MHAKYVFLQRSYSAPVRVSDMLVAVLSDAARDTTFVRFVFVRDVAARAAAGSRFCADVRGVVPLRGTNVVLRGDVLRFTVVAVRLWTWGGFFSFLVRETAVPSRTAPPAMPTQVNMFAAKNRIFFISDASVAKICFLSQANNL